MKDLCNEGVKSLNVPKLLTHVFAFERILLLSLLYCMNAGLSVFNVPEANPNCSKLGQLKWDNLKIKDIV